jgi:hypothetical protein
MTIIVWDGKTLATDSAIFVDDVIVNHEFNKIIKTQDYVYSIAGTSSFYEHVHKEMVSKTTLVDFENLDKDSNILVFHKKHKNKYFVWDGSYWSQSPLTEKIALGGPDVYAYALLTTNLSSVNIVNRCIKNHTLAGGKTLSLDIGKHFGW